MKSISRSTARSAGQRQKKPPPVPAQNRANPAFDSIASRYWLLLTYKVPPDPAKRRIALWRKLKALGAVYLQSGVCLLPKTEEHARRLKVLEREIADMEGEAVLLETVALDRAQEEKVVARFSAERDEAYVEFISRCDDFEAEIARERGVGKFTYAEVEENEEDLTKLRAWLVKIIRLDFCGAALRGQAEERVARCAALLDEYARQVFEVQDENRHGQGPSGGGKGV
jgi:hypothetical protein